MLLSDPRYYRDRGSRRRALDSRYLDSFVISFSCKHPVI